MGLRDVNLGNLEEDTFDVLIVGGGINGAVSAAALASRGAKVAVIDRADFASFTSQESSNLVWGGFKYLENYEIPLVRKLCVSRNRLLKSYPDNIKEIRFMAALDHSSPHPPWLAVLGAFAYWGIGSFRTRPPRAVSAQKIEAEEPVVNTTNVRGGIEYSDSYLIDNDSRFVFHFIRSALNVGAVAANYVELVTAEQRDGYWHSTLRDVETDKTWITRSRTLINATGPFVDGITGQLELDARHRIVWSKGIHLVVEKLAAEERVLAFYDDSQRLFYVIPMGARSMIGTTDTRVDRPETQVTDGDRQFLLGQINARLDLDEPLTTADVISERCGVRPLVLPVQSDDKLETDWTALSRKHEIDSDPERAVVTIYGGKLTDCLNVGEEVCDEISSLGIVLEEDRGDWYGEPSAQTRSEFFRQARLMNLDGYRTAAGKEPLTNRLWRRYGLRAFAMLEAIRSDESMAEDIMENADYLRVELHLAAGTEMITHLEDFLRRRSKIALVVRSGVIRESKGLLEACEILFGDRAQAEIDRYFDAEPSVQ